MCHVLIIEDEALIALDLEWLLESEGASSFAFAVSQDEAEDAARSRRPDIITADVSLIQGTGPGAVKAIRKVLGDIPVLYISATAIDCCKEDRLTRVLPKPLNRAAVTYAFHELRELTSI